MTPHYSSDSHPSPLFPIKTEIKKSKISWSTFQVTAGLILLSTLTGLILGLVYALFLGILSGLLVGIIHGLTTGSLWAVIWYCNWSDSE